MNTYNSTIEIAQVIKNLLQVKMPKKQAKVIAEEISKSYSSAYPEKMLQIKCEQLMAQVEARIERLRSDIFKWSIGIVFTQMLGILLVLIER
jgi:hypothetical protein